MKPHRFLPVCALVFAALIAFPTGSLPQTSSTDGGETVADITTATSEEASCAAKQLQETLSEVQSELEGRQYDLSELSGELFAVERAQTRLKRGDPREKEAYNAYQKAYSLVLDEKWNEAVAALDGVEKKYASSGWADDACFWKVYAMEKGAQPDEKVFQEYERFLETYPDSKWREDAQANMIRIGNRLAQAGKSEYADKIRSLKESGEGDVAISALAALQMMGEDSMPQIIRLYDSTRNPAVKDRIISTFFNFNNPKAIDFLIRIAENDTSSTMREKAVNQLGIRITNSFQFYSSGSFPSSVNLTAVPAVPVASESPVAPEAPTISLGVETSQTGNIAVLTNPYGQLEGIRESKINAEQKERILAALGRITRKDHEESIRSQALFFIGRSSPNDSQIAVLEAVAKTDPSINVREKALFSLSQVPDNRGIPAIIAVAKSDANLALRRQAIRFLGMSRDPRAREALKEIVMESK
jgi:HEAT repeat protein